MTRPEPSTATRRWRRTGNVGTRGWELVEVEELEELEEMEELEELEELVLCLLALGAFSVVETGTSLLLVDDRYEEMDFKSTSHCSPPSYSTKCVLLLFSVLSEITLHVYHPSECWTSMVLPGAKREYAMLESAMLNTVATAGAREMVSL